MKLSLVVPCYNEAENVAAFQQEIIKTFDGCGYDYEIVFVNDGSKDATLHILKKLHAAQECPVKVVSLSRNFGKESAIYAGMDHADGDYISLIDADLQHNPVYVREMVQLLDDKPEYDVVSAYQDRRGDGKILAFFKKSFYGIMSRISEVDLHTDASDFRTFRRSVRNSLLELGEYHRFSKGLFSWVGYDTLFIPFSPRERHAGKTKWSFRKLLNYAIEGIIGFSTKPLRYSIYVGTFTAFAAIAYLIWVIIEKLVWGIAIPGYATIIVLILLLGSIQLFCIGLIGEYVGRTFEQSKNRPVYIAKDVLGYEDDEKQD